MVTQKLQQKRGSVTIRIGQGVGRTAGRPPLSHAYFSLNLLTLLSLPVPLSADDSQKIHFKDAFLHLRYFFDICYDQQIHHRTTKYLLESFF
jgi:hypothetical protein